LKLLVAASADLQGIFGTASGAEIHPPHVACRRARWFICRKDCRVHYRIQLCSHLARLGSGKAVRSACGGTLWKKFEKGNPTPGRARPYQMTLEGRQTSQDSNH
jgi:hypothetical protein